MFIHKKIVEEAITFDDARVGGLGFIHKNMPIEEQASQVNKVKRSENGMITDPVTLTKDHTLGEAKALMERYKISGLPVVDFNNTLIGIITNRDVKYQEDLSIKVESLMTKENLITSDLNTTLETAKEILLTNRVEKLPIVDEKYRLVGLITIKDIDNQLEYPNANKDKNGRLIVGAGVGVGVDTMDRVSALVNAGVDIITIDSAHGHSKGVIEKIREICREFPDLDIVGGNIVTAEAAKDLIDAGANVLKVGIGPGSICTTRVVAGVGVPQLSAIYNVYEYAKEQGIKVFATRSAGFDIYDLELMSELGIKMTNVPSYSPNAIAEHVLTSALRISRNTNKIQRNIEKHNFSWNPGILSRELRTLTVGVIGTGRIGTQAARLFNALGSKVLGYDVYQNEAAKEVLDYVENLDDLIANSDIITIHMPAIKEYNHMVNDEFLAKMKDNSILLNAARGMLVDTKAVLRALDSGKLLGAGLDVYENEGKYVPKNFEGKEFDDKLLQTLIDRDDVIYTPHTAFYTETAIQNLVEGGLEAAVEVVATGTSANVVNR